MHPRFENAFQQLPASLQAAIGPLIDKPDFAAMLTADDVNAVCEASQLDADALAFALLPLAAACAQAPISNFQVGAIAQGLSGNFYFGANMEFSAVQLQQTVHAEQSAVSHAWIRNERGLRAVTVNYTPCGHCRQFMNELRNAASLRIQLPGRQPAVLSHYLPDSFGPVDLHIDTLLMDDVNHGATLQNVNALARRALDAANRSHAPYSKAISGIALETLSGNIYTGRYAENAAFNPSLPPLQVALNLMNLAGDDPCTIKHAAVVERRNAVVSHWAISQIMLAELGCTDIEHHFIEE
ncbi:cytidine deaminase [Pectobacterium carotovorum]|uniref:cytidine deaminase n=1 Tax=Pectobacterium carotovorum TaxID=554 RepID=UPI000580ADC8|nr:cytidine deaminase [Pectobacterium carotovorum]KAA3667636.1 cytidine deaminase [Pectobacterium carotovorum subsp. carotovorum]KHS86468.1 cytidine deaminase [Pectobacterium carotovorum subsp. carotovorum]KHT11674.1 cytidine deaminase [Pectobacterium carotovorum subsp. carotovorum]KHT28606.1 cytidine deaminase [Pectobacterium carotovorum subsp. carotovorum]MBA0179286.1 cytidine deaminase [Pectobacterium carotovorum]